jgi:hypothetical protein
MITTQTKAAFERIEESLLGNTEDNLDLLIANLDRLLDRARNIKLASVQNDVGDY